MNTKEIQRLDMPWEKDYQYAQGVRNGNTVWLAGQLGHDDPLEILEIIGDRTCAAVSFSRAGSASDASAPAVLHRGFV